MILPTEEALEKEASGHVQCTKFLQAKDLKTPEEFAAIRRELAKTEKSMNAEAPSMPGMPGVEPAPKKRKRRQSYKTREMRATNETS